MAGINVPQYEIFKIGTDKLKYSKWNLNIDKKEAFKYQESVSLFEGQQFRIMAKKIMKKAKWKCDFSKLFMQVVIDQKTDFARATNRKGRTRMIIIQTNPLPLHLKSAFFGFNKAEYRTSLVSKSLPIKKPIFATHSI